jgi:hypothetical protein
MIQEHNDLTQNKSNILTNKKTKVLADCILQSTPSKITILPNHGLVIESAHNNTPIMTNKFKQALVVELAIQGELAGICVVYAELKKELHQDQAFITGFILEAINIQLGHILTNLDQNFNLMASIGSSRINEKATSETLTNKLISQFDDLSTTTMHGHLYTPKHKINFTLQILAKSNVANIKN